MGNLLILPPAPIAALAVSRGSGGQNLLTDDPKEIWLDNAVGSPAIIDIDLGREQVIDTLFLGCVANAASAATWSITCGTAGYDELALQLDELLRVPDRFGRSPRVTHAFWTGDDVLARYIRVAVMQPAGAAPLSIGALMAGLSFVPQYNQEWGSGRGVQDTGVMTRLPSGGFVLVEGARFGTYKWTLGDLTIDEVEALYELQLDRGETRRVLVVEDPERSAGLRNRLHYGLFTGLRPYDRRNAKQARWEFTMSDLVTEASEPVIATGDAALTLGGIPLTFGGHMITVGN